MAAAFMRYDGGYFDYPTANTVKIEGDKYAIYDAYGNAIGAHPKDEIAEFTTSADLMKAMKDKGRMES
ncbi:hypothetical protein ACTACN_17390 [Pseudomonas syringae]|uniref:hypothetical protein n=1 Tax=Pseudomonas syringae group TaxID=136849 RepID=UPI001F3826E2|nr:MULTISPECIES: hypothetical protein [Pseudomonas syringae group]MCF5715468.1 hypothetical protein [Pseudomonas tremae]MDF5774057.1 hypothetical protein [Pseudomonas syringae pv. syringae]UQB33700.1 hypothetical protein I9H06_10895 [Pseudomonas tremae]